MIGNKLEPFKFWCQKVLPNVYDDSLSYYEYLCKLNEYLNEVIGQINTLTDNMEDYEADLTATWLETKEYIDNYFNNLDVQQEINNKLDQMASDGTLSTLLGPVVANQIGDVVANQIGATVANQIDGVVANQIDDSVGSQIATPVATATAEWLSEHITPTTPTIDDTLTVQGAGADSFTVGSRLKVLNNSCDGSLASIDTQSGYWDTSDGTHKDYVTTLSCSYKFNVQPNSKIKIGSNVNGTVYILYYDKDENYLGYIFIYKDITVYIPEDAEICAFNYTTTEDLSAIEFYITNENVDKTNKISNTIEPVNFFNKGYITGIQKYGTNDRYGDVTANANYLTSELIPIKYFETLYVLANFAGNKYLYVTFFNSDLKAVDSVNGYIIIKSSFNANAKYFCVCTNVTELNTLMICNKFPNYYTSKFNIDGDNVLIKKYKRLEFGQMVGEPRHTVGGAIFPVDTSVSNLYCSYPFSVENMSKISYTNLDGYKLVIFANASGNVVSTQACNANTKGTITVPNGAVFALYYCGLSGNPQTQFSIVEGEDVPDNIYPFGTFEIEKLDTSVDPLKGVNIVFDGDSITEGAGVTDIQTGIAPNNNKGWGYWVQYNHPASNCYGYGQSGWTVGKIDGRTDSLLNHIASYPEDVDLFVLSGGYNDQAVQMAMGELVEVTDGGDAYFNATFDEYTFFGALESWFSQLRTNYPFAKIVYVITPKRVYSSDPVFNNDTKGVRVRDVLYSSGVERMDLFWDNIRKACDKWSIKYLDLSKECGVVGTGELTDPGLTIGKRYYQVTNDMPDFVHPNTNFYKKMIVPLVEQLIKTVMPN